MTINAGRVLIAWVTIKQGLVGPGSIRIYEELHEEITAALFKRGRRDVFTRISNEFDVETENGDYTPAAMRRAGR
jgi:hypothetical protein